MLSDQEQSLYVEFDELFALRERLRPLADQVRAQLVAAGLRERLEAEIFDHELELRGVDKSNLLIRLDSFRLEIVGARPELLLHNLAALILAQAEVFRLNTVEVGFTAWLKAGDGRPLNLVAQAFSPGWGVEPAEMLDRRFAMTWDWATATTGYSFHASALEDRELMLSLKAREGYMTLPELQTGLWIQEQRHRFEQGARLLVSLLGWSH